MTISRVIGGRGSVKKNFLTAHGSTATFKQMLLVICTLPKHLKLSDMTELQLMKMEDALEKAKWRYLGTGVWNDPVTGEDLPSSKAYVVMTERAKAKKALPTMQPPKAEELFVMWDMAHDALTSVAIAARKLGHKSFANEAETIANALEARVTALSNMAKAKH